MKKRAGIPSGKMGSCQLPIARLFILGIFLQFGISLIISACKGERQLELPIGGTLSTSPTSITITGTTIPTDKVISSPTSSNILPTQQVPFQPATSTIVPTTTTIPTSNYQDVRSLLATGTYLVFWRNNRWFVQDLEKGQPIQLMPFESTNSLAKLSRDGNKVAFVESDNQISILDLATGELKTYPNLNNLTHIWSIDWSIDGDKILYSGRRDISPSRPSGIYLINLNDGEINTLIDWEGNDQFSGSGGYDALWSPNGDWIAFENISFGDFKINTYLVDADCVENPSACRIEVKKIANGNFLDWSPNGKVTISCSIGGEYGPCVVDPEDLSSLDILIDINQNGKFEEKRFINDGHWSPNGEALAFSINYHADNIDYGDIYVMKSDGTGLINLTNSMNYEEINDWSSDGKYLAYTYYFGDVNRDNGDIYIIPMVGGEAVNITDTQNDDERFAFWMEIQ